MNARNATSNPNNVNLGNGRTGGSYTGNAVALPGGSAGQPAGNSPLPTGPTGRGGRAVSFGDATGQPTYSTPGTQATTSQPTGATPSRRGFFGGFFGNGANNASPAGQPTTAGQPMNNAGYNNSGYGTRQRNTGYGQAQGQGQPQMQQRSYSQPTYSQPQRTYSQPQMQQPSRSFGGGNFGGGGGGGSVGGGGGGGGSRGRR